jgi:hypothetical protein
MKKFMTTVMAALAIAFAAGPTITQSAFANEPMAAYEVCGSAQRSHEIAFYKGDNHAYVGLRNYKLSDYDYVKCDVYRDVSAETWNSKKHCYEIHVEVDRRFGHPYVKGDRERFGWPLEWNYGSHPEMRYDIHDLNDPLCATGHNCHRDLNSGLWVFRMGNSDNYYVLERNGSVELYDYFGNRTPRF